MSTERIYQLQQLSIDLLGQLIATPSFSKEEDAAAGMIYDFLADNKVSANRFLNNVWAVNKYFDPARPTVLLNSHHDTVKPNSGYTLDPFRPTELGGKMYGLGSNDAGASLVSLLATFLYFYQREGLGFNIAVAATAEEEISGTNGIEALLPELPSIHSAIVGEPTQMQMAVAERGLLVLDCLATGVSGHAAREEGDSALYKAMEDINTLRHLSFEKTSELLGKVKLSVTSIETANKAHNVVPAECRFLIDARVNECYTLEEVVEKITTVISSKVTPRSLRMRPSSISLDHPLVVAGSKLGKGYYGSPTTSDMALMPFPSLKMGPGDSSRSHTADEYVYVDEIRNGIKDYINLLNHLVI